MHPSPLDLRLLDSGQPSLHDPKLHAATCTDGRSSLACGFSHRSSSQYFEEAQRTSGITCGLQGNWGRCMHVNPFIIALPIPCSYTACPALHGHSSASLNYATCMIRAGNRKEVGSDTMGNRLDFTVRLGVRALLPCFFSATKLIFTPRRCMHDSLSCNEEEFGRLHNN